VGSLLTLVMGSAIVGVEKEVEGELENVGSAIAGVEKEVEGELEKEIRRGLYPVVHGRSEA
jgi:hypothetical protein